MVEDLDNPQPRTNEAPVIDPVQEVARLQQLLREVTEQRDTLQRAQELMSGMKTQFRRVGNEAAARDRLFNGKHRQTGTVQQYTAEFRKLQLDLPRMAESCTVYYYIQGLRDDTRVQLTIQNPTSLADAIVRAERTDLALQPTRRVAPENPSFRPRGSFQRREQQPRPSSQAPSNQGRGGYRPPTRTTGQRTPGVPFWSPEQFHALLESGRCLRCAGQGHIARDCTASRPADPRTTRLNGIDREEDA